MGLTHTRHAQFPKPLLSFGPPAPVAQPVSSNTNSTTGRIQLPPFIQL
jgi:hypothetical protein